MANRTWIGLWCLLFPTVGWWFLNLLRILLPTSETILFYAIGFALELGIMLFLGRKGNRLAWQNPSWHSITQFKSHQRKWAIAGILIGITFYLALALLKLLFFALSTYQLWGDLM